MNETSSDARLYAWAPRSEVAYLQATIDAYEGIARIRTERHEGDRSLLFFLLQSSQKKELIDLLRQIETEIEGRIELI